jgi:hypothetical protein
LSAPEKVKKADNTPIPPRREIAPKDNWQTYGLESLRADVMRGRAGKMSSRNSASWVELIDDLTIKSITYESVQVKGGHLEKTLEYLILGP